MIVVGAGGHARSVIGVLQDIGCRIAGTVADGVTPGEVFPGINWLGGLEQAKQVCLRLPTAAWVMAIGDNYHRLRIMHAIQDACPEVVFPPVVHPSAVVSGDVMLEEGAVVMPGAVVMAGCRLGTGSLVNTRASLDHESVLADGASLAPGAITGGRVVIGRSSFVGSGAVLVQGVTVGADTVLGAGSLLLRDLPNGVIAYGHPAAIIRERKEDEPYL